MKKNSKQPQGWPAQEPDWLKLAARMTQTAAKDWHVARTKAENAPTPAAVRKLKEQLAEEDQTLLRDIALWGPNELVAAGSIVDELLVGQRVAFLIARVNKSKKRRDIIMGIRTPWPTDLVPGRKVRKVCQT